MALWHTNWATFRQTNCQLRLRKSGKPSFLSLRKQWILPSLRTPMNRLLRQRAIRPFLCIEILGVRWGIKETAPHLRWGTKCRLSAGISGKLPSHLHWVLDIWAVRYHPACPGETSVQGSPGSSGGISCGGSSMFSGGISSSGYSGSFCWPSRGSWFSSM